MFDIEVVCIETEDEGVMYTEEEYGVVMCVSRQVMTEWMRSKQWYVTKLVE